MRNGIRAGEHHLSILPGRGRAPNANQLFDKEKGKLILKLLPSPVFISDLTPLHYDTFSLQLRNTFSFIPSGKGTVQFIRDKKGKVVEMKVDIPNNDFHFTELEFKRRIKDNY